MLQMYILPGGSRNPPDFTTLCALVPVQNSLYPPALFVALCFVSNLNREIPMHDTFGYSTTLVDTAECLFKNLLKCANLKFSS